MYIKTFDSEKIRVEDEDMKKLLERFDINKFKPSPNKEYYINDIECVLCAKYNKGDYCCLKCPFVLFNHRHIRHGCTIVMDKLLDTITPPYSKYRAIFVPIRRVFYCVEDSNVALKELKVITDFLKSFKKE